MFISWRIAGAMSANTGAAAVPPKWVGLSSPTAPGGSSIEISGAFAATPDLALGNSKFSQNSWLLQPGNYSFSFKSTKFAPTYTNGTVAFKAEQLRVPDSGTTLVLLGSALAGIAGLRASRCAGAKDANKS